MFRKKMDVKKRLDDINRRLWKIEADLLQKERNRDAALAVFDLRARFNHDRLNDTRLN